MRLNKKFIGQSLRGLRLRLQRDVMIISGIRAYDPKQRKTSLAGPSQVQVQTIDRCNASCLMCPYSASEKSGQPCYMEEKLYRKILNELKYAGTVHSFVPMLQSEPLLDRDISRRLREAKEILGSTVSVHMVTNGSILTPELADELLDSGLDTLSVSIDAFREETYKAIRKGLIFSRVIDNLQSLLQRHPPILVIARFLKQRANEREEKMFKQFWKARGARISFHSVVNRAGMLNSFDQIERLKTEQNIIYRFIDKIFPFCFLPFFALNVLWDGRVILCCHDWGPSVVVGDLTKQSLPEVWNGEEMNHYRHLLYSDLSKESPSCVNCSLRNGLWGNQQ